MKNYYSNSLCEKCGNKICKTYGGRCRKYKFVNFFKKYGGIYMKLFKTIDDKFKEIGFTKTIENKYIISYSRPNYKHQYVQTLDLIYKSSGRHIVQSYDGNLKDEKGIGHTCVGLSMYEMELCIKKMKKMGWKVLKNKETL